MDKKIGHVTFTETDSGYRIDVEGKDLKGLFASCCCCGGNCCSDKTESTDCCGGK